MLNNFNFTQLLGILLCVFGLILFAAQLVSRLAYRRMARVIEVEMAKQVVKIVEPMIQDLEREAAIVEQLQEELRRKIALFPDVLK